MMPILEKCGRHFYQVMALIRRLKYLNQLILMRTALIMPGQIELNENYDVCADHCCYLQYTMDQVL